MNSEPILIEIENPPSEYVEITVTPNEPEALPPNPADAESDEA